jgi:hypothetical protein
MVLAGQGYYYGFVRPPKVLYWLQQSTFIISLFILTPLLSYVLYSQSGAKKRLEVIGLRPHPAIVESIGLGNGTGDNPVWVFKIDAEKNQVMDFYKTRDNIDGWIMTLEHDFIMMFERGSQRMMIAYREGWNSKTLAFNLNEN